MPILAPSVRRATAADAPALADLINAAYAVEEFFVDGDRTTPGEVAELVANGTFVVLEDDAVPGRLAAAVYVERGYFGMLSVRPELQGRGLGKRMVRIAEALCEAHGCHEVDLRIINLREELARWYRSLGYREVGTRPYEHRPTKRPCHFVEMRKAMTR